MEGELYADREFDGRWDGPEVGGEVAYEREGF
jgi:hypothetical protein